MKTCGGYFRHPPFNFAGVVRLPPAVDLAKRARAIGEELSAARWQVFCVGRKTAEAAAEAGLSVHHVASGGGDAEALLAELIEAEPAAGLRILIPKSDLGRTVLADGLSAAGADFSWVEGKRLSWNTSLASGVWDPAV